MTTPVLIALLVAVLATGAPVRRRNR